MHKKQLPDLWLLFTFLILLSLGLVLIFSATPTTSLEFGDIYYYFKRQLLYVGLALFAAWVGFRMNYLHLRRWSIFILLFAIGLLLILFVPGLGRSAGGATRWIYLGPLSFQPSELAKLAIIIFLANALVNKGSRIKDFVNGILPLLLIVFFTAAIIFLQPDLGTAIMLVLIAFSMLYAGGARVWHLLILFFLGVEAVLALSMNSPYRMNRLMAFVDPWKDPLGIGFNIIQSLLAVGSGGVLGVGLGASMQKFFYLPGQYTDFIFAILCEETGFLGAAIVLGLFLAFSIRGIRTAVHAGDQFGRLLSFGIIVWIAGQAILNMGVVVGLLPTTGIPLPFLSFGGTSLILSSFAVGILLNISKTRINTNKNANQHE